MPYPSKRKLQLKGALESLAKKRKLNKRQVIINKITDYLEKTNPQELQTIHHTVFNIPNTNEPRSSKTYNSIINTLNEMSETNLKSTSHLLRTMRYPRGQNKNQIISPYIQNKAFNYISDSLYKSGKSSDQLNYQNKQLQKNVKKLQRSNNRIVHKVQQLGGTVGQLRRKQRRYISQIRAKAKQPPELKDKDIKTVIRNLIMKNNKEYNFKFMKLATQVSQIGQTSFIAAAENIKTVFNFLTGDDTQSWVSETTISRWHREISEVQVQNIFQRANQSNYFTFGIWQMNQVEEKKKYLSNVLCSGIRKKICLIQYFWKQKIFYDVTPILLVRLL